MRRIVHIITGLGNGGAEMMLYKLIEHMDKSQYEISVISMMDKGIMGPKLEELGIKVFPLNMKRGVPDLNSIKKAIEISRGADIIQSWMYHADLFAFLVSRFTKPQKLIWGIRRSNLEKDKNKRQTLLVAKINSFLSKYVYKIVSCSIVATNVHIKYGYDAKRIVTIPNGFSIEKYKKIQDTKNIICKEFGINRDKKIFSLVGRWEILKDHENCLKALKIISEKRKDFVLLLCGTGITSDNEELVQMISKMGLKEYVYLLGRREDIPLVMSATDIYISSSSGEGFPNVIGEAMACETVCVVTDVGDSAYIVGNTGLVVPRKNPEALAEGIKNILDMEEIEIINRQKKARERIIDNFEISKIVKQYIKLYEEV